MNLFGHLSVAHFGEFCGIGKMNKKDKWRQ